MNKEKSFTTDSRTQYKLWYNQPAQSWWEALPIGNGRMGAMVYGDPKNEKICLNDDTLWSGEPYDWQNYNTINYVEKVRKLIMEGNLKKAEDIANKTMLGHYTQAYMPLGDVDISFEHTDNISNYYRELDIDKAIVHIEYTTQDVRYEREIFASAPDDIIVMRIKANKQCSINFKFKLSSKLKFQTQSENNYSIMTGICPIYVNTYDDALRPKFPERVVYDTEKNKGISFDVRVKVKNTGGTVTSYNGITKVANADEAVIYIETANSFNGYNHSPSMEGIQPSIKCISKLRKASNKSIDEIYLSHVRDYQKLYNRVDISIGDTLSEKIPTDKLLKQPEGITSALAGLYYQYARYLMIACSRPGTQPANLQGIWSYKLLPAWSANYTLNCNVQINYWLPESANLQECHEPLLKMISELSVDGRRTAKIAYGCRGWMAHHNTDIWRMTTATDGSIQWSIFKVGGAWLCHHLWEHYAFTLDQKYLRKIYPIMHDAALFFVDFLVEDEEGRLVTSPAVSFENQYELQDGKGVYSICMGPTEDMQIIRELFTECINASKILKIDEKFCSVLENFRSRLVPMQISPRTGELQEWLDDWDSTQPAAQMGHLWGLYPGTQVTKDKTPELFEATRKVLEHRHPWETTGSGSWMGAWPTNAYARLRDGNMAWKVMSQHLAKDVTSNLACKFIGWEVDGNFGVASAVAEMLVQSHTGEINILPALPSSWSKGYVKGLRVRGNMSIDIKWDQGKLKSVVFHPYVNKKYDINLPQNINCFLVMCDGKELTNTFKGTKISIDMVADKQYTIMYKEYN